MSVFTTVTPEQLSVWLEGFDLGELLELEGIASGIENTNYFVTTSRARYVLTLFEKLTQQELPFYLNLMAHLAQHQVPCPNPVPDKNNRLLGELNGKPASIVTCLKGKSLENPAPHHCGQVGKMLAQMHIAGTGYSAKMDNPRGARWWKAVTPEISPYLESDQAELLLSEIEFQQRNEFDLPSGVIHADLFRDNVLFDGHQIGGLIDFYFACNDRLLFDIAITVNDWCMGADHLLDEEKTRTFLRAYDSVRPLSSAERGAWPVMLRAAALRFWVSRLYDFHLPRPGELTHAKDPRHFERILKSHLATPCRYWL